MIVHENQTLSYWKNLKNTTAATMNVWFLNVHAEGLMCIYVIIAAFKN
jgi:hypothetical protein